VNDDVSHQPIRRESETGRSYYGSDTRVDGGEAKASKFDAFVSYSHATDNRIAPSIVEGLRNFAKPWYKLRALRVFRDETSLPASAGLLQDIQAGLAESNFFILLASPGAARSKWVDRELRYWLAERPVTNLLIALTDGTLLWNDALHVFDQQASSSLPPALQKAFDDEPRIVDLRWTRDVKTLSLRNPRFRDAVADLAAPLHGRPKDELIGEDIRQHRRTVRVASSVAVTLSILTVLSIIFGVVAAQQRNQAVHQRFASEGLGIVAEANALASRNPRLSLLLSANASRYDSWQARASILETLGQTHYAGTFLGQNGPVTSVAFDPAGGTLASASPKGVLLWDLATGKVSSALTGSSRPANLVAFSPDGRALATAGSNNSVLIWAVARHPTPVEVAVLKRQDAVTSMAFSPKGHLLAAADEVGGTIAIWNVASLAQPRYLGSLSIPPVDARVYSLAFSPDGTTMAVGTLGSVVVWDLAHPAHPRLERTLNNDLGSLDKVQAVAFSPDGPTLAAGTNSGSIVLWRVAGRAGLTVVSQIAPHNLFDGVSALAFSPDGRQMVSGNTDHIATLWNVRPGGEINPLATLAGQGGTVNSVAFGRGGSIIATGSADSSVMLWRSMTDANGQLAVLSGSVPVYAIAISPNNRTLAAGSQESDIVLWDLHAPGAPHKDRALDVGATVNALAFSPNGRILASGIGGNPASLSLSLTAGATNYPVILWDLATARPFQIAKLRVPQDIVYSLAFTKDGRILATGDSNSVILWNLSRPDSPRRLNSILYGGPVSAVAFSRNDRTLAAVSPNGIGALWDVTDPARPHRLALLPNAGGGFNTVSFSPNGDVLAIASTHQTVTLWDVTNPASPHLLGSLGYSGSVDSVDFSPDGRTLAVAGANGTSTLWDVTQPNVPRLLATLPGQNRPVFDVRFSHNGNVLASASYNHTVSIFDMVAYTQASLSGVVCAMPGSKLSTAEWSKYGLGLPYPNRCG
jgi:WD40 repeat protein